MSIADKTVLITGANRGIGQALVEEALRRGASRVYAAARRPAGHPDERVTPLTLDVTDAAQVRAAADRVGSLDVLVNNAGLALFDGLGDRATLERHLAVNLFGTYAVTEAFLPQLTSARGTIVNNLSLNALAPLPVLAAYSVSKAAAFSLTQSLRASLAERGVRVHAVLTGPVDTDMVRALDIPKASPQSVARAIFDAVDRGEEDIFPDPLSQSLADGWRNGAAKAFERQLAERRQAGEDPLDVPAVLAPVDEGEGKAALAGDVHPVLGVDVDMDVLAPGPDVHPRLGGYLPGRQVRLPDLETALPHGLQAGLADLLPGAGKTHVVPIGHSHVRG